MSKQTAVMYFINELKKSKDFQRVINEVNLSSTSVRDVIQETLQMEREQIIEAFKHGELPPAFVNFDAKEYYNDTYGGKDESDH
jgi:superfamily II DNA or RNA helicase